MIVGRDIKPTGELLLKGAIASLLAHGVKNVENLGITSLPAMEWAVNHFRASGGIFITASHNPMEWNGIKFISSFQDGGSLLPASAMEKIKDGWRSEVNKIKKREINLPELPEEVPFVEDYIKDVIDKIKKTIDLCADEESKGDEIFTKIKERQMRIALDACSGDGLEIPKNFLLQMGIDEKNIYPVNNGTLSECRRRFEPTPNYLTGLKEIIEQYNLDIGFAFDPDQDRLVVMPLRNEELTLIIAGRFLLELQNPSAKKYINAVAINLSTSSLWDELAEKYGIQIIRTRVGEMNVIEAMEEYNLPFGGEGNGGVILREVNPGRNSTVGMGLILAYMAWRDCSLKELEAELTDYVIVKEKIEVLFSRHKIQELLGERIEKFKERNREKVKSIDTRDGYKIILHDNSWIHIRPSNTEPIIRLITESTDEERARQLAEDFKIILQD